jgi:hypothetical protein
MAGVGRTIRIPRLGFLALSEFSQEKSHAAPRPEQQRGIRDPLVERPAQRRAANLD